MISTKLGRATYYRILCVALGVGASVLACSSDSPDDAGHNPDSGKTGLAGGSSVAGAGSSTRVGEGGDGTFTEGGGATSNPGTSGGASSGSTAGGSNVGTAGTSTSNAACNNGLDDDGDGLIDGLDPECTGPLDNDEGSFATGIPGDNRDPKWQDCFFDGNSGAGDDGCRYRTECLYGDLPPDDPNCTVTDQCVKFCAPLAQNGCDCFGCCTVQAADGSTVDILEAASCSLASLDDEKACPRCTKSTQCGNECGECELCPGKTVEDLPSSCNKPPSTGGAGGNTGTGGAPSTGGSSNGGDGGAVEPPPSYTCDGGEQVCGQGLPACPGSYYCLLGCCVPSVR